MRACVQVFRTRKTKTSQVISSKFGLSLLIDRESKDNTCAAMGAFTVEGRYSVVAGGSLVACSTDTIINVLAAVIPSPAIHAHTLVAAISVVTRAPVLAGVRHQLALIDILRAQLTCGTPGGGLKQFFFFFFPYFFHCGKEHYKPVNSGLHWQL